MSKPNPTRIARSWIERHLSPQERKVTPTEFQLRDLKLPVSEVRFERAMVLVARNMGGTYNKHTSSIMLPKDLAQGGRLPFTELGVLYRKFPCGMIIKDVSQGNGAAGYPCVSFDVIPNIGGDPRRSRFYKTFQGEAGTSKRLFNQFVGWLAILSKAVKRYRQQVEAGKPANFGRVASVERVAARWLLSHVPAEGSRRSA